MGPDLEINGFYLFLTFFLVLLNGFFVAAEFAMVRVRGSQLELKADFAWLAAILHNPITWGASARYSDIRIFGPGWRLDLNGFYRHEDTNRFGLITRMKT